jgi:bacterioferritin-associated ferredoxin
MSIQECKAVTDAQINKVMEVIEHLVDKFAASLKQIQSQLKEQKQVTDWVKKEYNLRPI